MDQLWFIVDRTIVNGVFKPTYNWGAPSCRFLVDFGASNSEVLDANLFVLLSFSLVVDIVGLCFSVQAIPSYC